MSTLGPFDLLKNIYLRCSVFDIVDFLSIFCLYRQNSVVFLLNRLPLESQNQELRPKFPNVVNTI